MILFVDPGYSSINSDNILFEFRYPCRTCTQVLKVENVQRSSRWRVIGSAVLSERKKALGHMFAL